LKRAKFLGLLEEIRNSRLAQFLRQ
jgi:hypothetical protein